MGSKYGRRPGERARHPRDQAGLGGVRVDHIGPYVASDLKQLQDGSQVLDGTDRAQQVFQNPGLYAEGACMPQEFAVAAGTQEEVIFSRKPLDKGRDV